MNLKNLIVFFALIILVLNTNISYSNSYDGIKVTDSHDIPLIFTREPSDYKIKEIDGLNVLFQYGKAVPSFDTWDTEEEGRSHLSLNGEWTFTFEDIKYQGVLSQENEDIIRQSSGIKEKWYSPFYDDSHWKKVEVPHVWDLEGVEDWFDYNTGEFNTDEVFRREFGWYRKTFEVDQEFIEERFLRLNALGIQTVAWIFINGQYVGAADGGYEHFSMDIGDYLQTGKNTIVIRVWRRPIRRGTDGDLDSMGGRFEQHRDHQNTFGSTDPFAYGGIYRELWIESVSPIHISKIITKAEKGNLNMYAIIYNADNKKHTLDMAFDSGTGDALAYKKVSIKPKETRVIKKKLAIPSAKNWSYRHPNMYTGKVTIFNEARVIDTLTVDYGMRDIKIEANKLYLNGNRILLKGFSWMEDFYPVARAIPKELYEFHVDFIKNTLKANFLRNTHHPRNKMAYELTDEYGLMVMEESANVWMNSDLMNYQVNTYKLAEARTASVTWNNINHPSIIMWSLGNELGNVNSVFAENFVKKMNEITQKIDIQNRPTTYAFRAEGQWNSNIGRHIDIYSFNQKNDNLTAQRGVGGKDDGLLYILNQIVAKYPDKPIIFSENGRWSTHYYNTNQQVSIFNHWDLILSEEYPILGFSMFTYNDYKNTNWGIPSAGISRFGVVNYNFNLKYKEEVEKMNEPYMKFLGYHFHELYNPYSYPKFDNYDLVWQETDIDLIMNQRDKELNFRASFEIIGSERIEDEMDKDFWWYDGNKNSKLEINNKIINVEFLIRFYKFNAGKWVLIEDERVIEKEILNLESIFGTDFNIDIPEVENNINLIRAEIDVSLFSRGNRMAYESYSFIIN
ncbi:glycoside hydrolase family 2 protein [Natronospora cellulosivora (SeqCode)]